MVQGTKYVELDKNWKPIKETDAGGTRLPRETTVSVFSTVLAQSVDPNPSNQRQARRRIL